MGSLQTVASHCGTDYGNYSVNDVLGASELAEYCENRVYDDYILPARVGLYLCQYSVWNLVRCDDAEH